MNSFEVKIKEYKSGKSWEELKPTVVLFTTDDWQDALQSYITYLEENNVDLSNVWEYRINYTGSPQGHYRNVGFEKVLSGKWTL